jgi:putative transposase
MSLYKNYRSDSLRLKGYNYSSDGLYFVTICVHRNACCLGRVTENGIHLSAEGKLAEQYWQAIPSQFNHVFLGESIIMPNHIHGIIGIHKPSSSDVIHHVADNAQAPDQVIHYVAANTQTPDHHATSKPGGITGKHNPMLSNHSLGKIIRWYKGRCTYEIQKQLQVSFQWQSGYYEHIIRTRQALINIENYIIANPANWYKDKNNLHP